MLAVGKGIYPADKHPDEGLRKFLQTTSEDRFITSQLQICLLDQVVPFWNSLAKTIFFLIYLFGRCWYAMTALSTPAATSHMLLFKIIKIKNFLKCSSYSYRPHSSAQEPFIRQCTQGTPPSVQKAQDSNAVHFFPEDPFQKEAILNSPHSWSQRLVLFQRPIPSLVMWNFFQISTLITLSTYKISPLFSNISVFEKFSCDRNNS